MNQVDQNINNEMIECDLIDVESMDFSDDQTWLYTVPGDTGEKLDILDWNLSCDWPLAEDEQYLKDESEFFSLLDNIIKKKILSMPDRNKFDSRTYVRPKKKIQRPSIHSIMESANTPSVSPQVSISNSTNKYLTYNKYNSAPISPMLRLKTFNVDTNSDNSTAVKEYAMKRRSLVVEDDPQLEDIDMTLVSDTSERLSSDHMPSKPINIDLSQPAHNLHNTFNKGITSMLAGRPSLNMYQSGESLMRMSPPSLVSSLLMESSGNFQPESFDTRKSMPSHKDSGIPSSGRDSIDPMVTSMTLSILDEKDMNTSFLSQTTYPDHDSFLDSLPPSLVSSVNSSYVISNSSKPKDSTDSNIFSSATFTRLEQSEKLLSARPRYQLYNSYTKRDSSLKNSESYTKSREEACQIDPVKVLNENSDNAKLTTKNEMGETITLHYSNNKFNKKNDAGKENLNATFEKSDAFFKDMGMTKTVDLGRNSIVLDKQELNEIIQARQKLSLARKGLPSDPDRLPNQVETVQLPTQTISVPRQVLDNASELLSRRRTVNTNGFDKQVDREEPTRETPKRNATFKKVSPKTNAMDATVVYVKDENQMIDINSATMNLIDSNERTLQQEEWSAQDRAMVGSSESTDTGTFSSSSPPDSVPDARQQSCAQIASTPIMSLKKTSRLDMLNLHTTISPIYDAIDDKSYTVTKVPSGLSEIDRDFSIQNTTVINSGTIVKRTNKGDVLKTSPIRNTSKLNTDKPQPRRLSPPNAVTHGSMAPPTTVPRKSSLPTSKLRQYSSHRELSRIPANPTTTARSPTGRPMVRRNVYASNPALSPTEPLRRDAFALGADQEVKPATKPAVPTLVRQGTETLRRERPQSQLVAPRDPPTTRPYSIAGASQLRISRPASGPLQRPSQPQVSTEVRPASGVSALPRPSRLPAPRRTLRPPSVYSVAPTGDADQY